MPRQLAFLIYVGFIIWLFRADMKLRRAGSWALLIPGLWLAITGSRPVTYWLGSYGDLGTTNVEGNAINMVIFGALMVAALFVLQRRAFDWGAVLMNNKALIAIYLYFLLSFVWSFYPLPTMKRILKDFGCVLMVLVFLTEPDPIRAARIIFTRCAYLLFPLSVLLIKYYPEYGRMYAKNWELMYTGVTTHKNTLGLVVVVFGLMVVLDLLAIRKDREGVGTGKAFYIRCLILLMGSWLLFMSNSKTSLLCLILGLGVYWASHHLEKLRNPRSALLACVSLLVSVALIQVVFDVKRTVIEGVGRNETLTGRTEMWEVIRAQKTNPILGWGFYAFWDTPAARAYNEEGETSYVTAHNGYLDMYLDGGGLALLLFAVLVFMTGNKVFLGLFTEDPYRRARFMFFVIALVYNCSESSFFRMDPLWSMFLLVAINYSRVPEPERNFSRLVDEPGTAPVRGWEGVALGPDNLQPERFHGSVQS